MSERKPLVIIHFHAVEKYPPVMNLVDSLGDRQVLVLTTAPNPGTRLFEPGIPNAQVLRLAVVGKANPGARYLAYLSFYLKALLVLLRKAPRTVLYYETLSSWPALMYKRMRPRSRVMAHYHEYTSPEEYATGMRLVKQFYRMEQQAYPSLSWISHTNPLRIRQFLKDNPGLQAEVRCMANYPPGSWRARAKDPAVLHRPVRLVYVGAISLQNMFARELLDWLDRKNGAYTLDIYSNNTNPETVAALSENAYTTVHPAVSYHDLPGILPQYDVGLVLYKPFNLNTVYTASNKLFEYYQLGLDTWISNVMIASESHVQEDALPKVLLADFAALDRFDDRAALEREGLPHSTIDYSCEKEYRELISFIDQNDHV